MILKDICFCSWEDIDLKSSIDFKVEKCFLLQCGGNTFIASTWQWVKIYFPNCNNESQNKMWQTANLRILGKSGRARIPKRRVFEYPTCSLWGLSSWWQRESSRAESCADEERTPRKQRKLEFWCTGDQQGSGRVTLISQMKNLLMPKCKETL